jgi:hypothetical protein
MNIIILFSILATTFRNIFADHNKVGFVIIKFWLNSNTIRWRKINETLSRTFADETYSFLMKLFRLLSIGRNLFDIKIVVRSSMQLCTK